MAGYTVVKVNVDSRGNIDVDDLRKKAEQHKDRLAALMVTYPSTHGVFRMNIALEGEIVRKLEPGPVTVNDFWFSGL